MLGKFCWSLVPDTVDQYLVLGKDVYDETKDFLVNAVPGHGDRFLCSLWGLYLRAAVCRKETMACLRPLLTRASLFRIPEKTYMDGTTVWE